MSTLFARLAAVFFFINAILHTTAYKGVTNAALAGGPEVRAVTAVLWLSFGIGMAALGVIVWLNAKPTSPHRAAILLLATCLPLSTAVLQLLYMGPIFPEALLGATSALTIIAAVTAPSRNLTAAAPAIE